MKTQKCVNCEYWQKTGFTIYGRCQWKPTNGIPQWFPILAPLTAQYEGEWCDTFTPLQTNKIVVEN